MHALWRLASAVALVLLLAGGAGTALADPINSPKAVPFAITCGGERLSIISPNEPTSSLLVVGETTVGVATVATLTTTYTDPQSGATMTDVQTFVYGSGHGKAQGLQGTLTSCSETVVVEDPVVGPITVTLAGNFLLTQRS